MTTTDWLIDITLVLIVLRQLREARMDLKFLLIPAAIVYFTASHYLHGIPTSGNDLVLIVGCAAAGALLGVAGGLTTRVRAAGGHAFVKAGPAAAAIWVTSMTARLGFIIWCTHGSGEHTLARFSMSHQISADAWQTALVLLALSEVVVRFGFIVIRGVLATTANTTPDTTATPVTSDEQPQLVTI
jgi:hypothetical protein